MNSKEIHTGGGASVDGNVNTSGGDFVGRDKREFSINSDSVANAVIGETIHQYNFMASSGDVRSDVSLNIGDYRISEDELKETRMTFAPAKGFVQTAQSFEHNRILIIRGEEGVGKRTLAIYLAAESCKEDKVANVFELSDELDVNYDIFLSQHVPSVFIIDDVFASNYSLAARLLGKDSGSLSRLLNLLKNDDASPDKFSRLIFTIHDKNWGRLNSQFSRLSGQKIAITSCQCPSAEDVLLKHLAFHMKGRDNLLLEKCGDYLLEKVVLELQQPQQIARLVNDVLRNIDLEQIPELIKAQIAEGIATARTLDNEIEKFFESLDKDEKLLALNLSLLGSYRNRDLWESYPEAHFWHMHALIMPKRDNGNKNTDDTKLDKDKDDRKEKQNQEPIIKWSSTSNSVYLEQIRAKVSLYRVPVGEEEQNFSYLRFKDKQYAQAILTYVKKNHSSFLLGMLAHLVHLAEQYKSLVQHTLLDNKRHVQAILDYVETESAFCTEVISDLLNLVQYNKDYAKAVKSYVKDNHSVYFTNATKQLDTPSEEEDALFKSPDLKDIPYAKAILRYAGKDDDFQKAIISDLHNCINYFESYCQNILDYVASRHPGYLQEVAYEPPPLDEKIEAYPSDVILSVAYILGLISNANWRTVAQRVHEWAISDQPQIREMASYVLGAAHRDSEIETYVQRILKRYVSGKDKNLLSTAAKTYEVIGWIDLETALNGLEEIAYRLDLSSWAFVEPTMAYLNELAEAERFRYFLEQANVSSLDNKRSSSVQYQQYIQKYLKAFEEYDQVIKVYYAVANAMWLLARYVNMKEVFNILSDWANDVDKMGIHTVQLVASSIGLYLAKTFTQIAEEEKSQNRLLELISHDEEARDALADLFGSSLIRLYKIQFPKQRKSWEICLLLEKWANSAEITEALADLLFRIQIYLRADPVVLKYFNYLFERRWQSAKMSETIRALADRVLHRYHAYERQIKSE